MVVDQGYRLNCAFRHFNPNQALNTGFGADCQELVAKVIND